MNRCTASTRFIPAIRAKQHSQKTIVNRSPQYALAVDSFAVFCGAIEGAADLVSTLPEATGGITVCAVMGTILKTKETANSEKHRAC